MASYGGQFLFWDRDSAPMGNYMNYQCGSGFKDIKAYLPLDDYAKQNKKQNTTS